MPSLASRIIPQVVETLPDGGYFIVETAQSHNLWKCVGSRLMDHVLTRYHSGATSRTLARNPVSRTDAATWSGAKFTTVPRERWDAIEMAIIHKLPDATLCTVAGMPKRQVA